jgi:hypothetical protein
MLRGLVDEDRDSACSVGLHVGTFGYAQRFSEQMLVVLVDPADVVSVPTHGDAEKRRVCRLFVAARHDGDQLAQAVVDHICTVPDFDAGWDFAGRPETAVRRSVWPATSRLPDDLDEDEDDDSGY